MRRFTLVVVAWLAFVGWAPELAAAKEPAPSDFGPVSLRARYRLGATGPAGATLTLAERDTIPRVARTSTEAGADDVRLLDVALHLNEARLNGLAAGTVERFRILTYLGARGGRQLDSREIPLDQLAKEDQSILPVTDDLGVGLPTIPLTVVIRAELSKELLCAFESSLRLTKGTPRAAFRSAAGTAPTLNALSKPGGVAPADLPAKVLAVPGPAGDPVELLFSFCGSGQVDWERAAREPLFALGDGALTGHALSDLHKKRLVDLLRKEKLLSPFEHGGLAIHTERPDPADREDRAHERTRVFVESTMSFSVVPTPHPFLFSESGPSAPADGGKGLQDERLMDQRSRVEVREASGCPDWGAPLTFRVRRLSDGSAPQLAKLGGAGCEGLLDVDMKRYLGDAVEVTAVYEFPADRFDPPARRTVVLAAASGVQVANLGLITTFPIVSELISAANAKSTKDITSTSSIPISWVFGLAGNRPGDTVAVTFPWKLSYNSRRVSDLARYFAVYPHVSVLFPLATGDSSASRPGGAKLAVGLGVSVAQVFDFAWAVRPGAAASVPAHYLLVGVSIPDIVKLLQAH